MRYRVLIAEEDGTVVGEANGIMAFDGVCRGDSGYDEHYVPENVDECPYIGGEEASFRCNLFNVDLGTSKRGNPVRCDQCLYACEGE